MSLDLNDLKIFDIAEQNRELVDPIFDVWNEKLDDSWVIDSKISLVVDAPYFEENVWKFNRKRVKEFIKTDD
jgi:hypothetical protein